MAFACIGVRTMSRPNRQPFVAVIDTRNLRRASITGLLEPWAKSEDLQLKSFTPEQADEALDADTSFRMLVFSVGGASIAEGGNLEQLRILRRLAPKVPLVLISDSEDPHDIVAAFNTEAQGFIDSGISLVLAYQALSFILNGGSYFPPSAMYQLQMRQDQVDKSRGSSSDGEYGAKGNGSTGALTTRERDVLKHLRMGESNKLIARRLSMTEGTVKVHIRQMMKKCQVANRTQLALGGPQRDFDTDNEHSSATKNVAERQPSASNGGCSVVAPPPTTPLRLFNRRDQ
jgi:DNA-binding NarL/FixJ family response regulator